MRSTSGGGEGVALRLFPVPLRAAPAPPRMPALAAQNQGPSGQRGSGLASVCDYGTRLLLECQLHQDRAAVPTAVPAQGRSVHARGAHVAQLCRRRSGRAEEAVQFGPRPGPDILTASDFSFPPQLLNSLSVDPDAECKHGLYFRDGRRKVDYILVYHPKRPSGSRTLARRVPHSDAPLAARGARQDQPLPGKGSMGAAGGPEPPMDYHEDDKRFRREEYEGNLLEAGLELERDEDVTIPASCGLVGWARLPGSAGHFQKVVWGGALRL